MSIATEMAGQEIGRHMSVINHFAGKA